MVQSIEPLGLANRKNYFTKRDMTQCSVIPA